MCFNIWKQLVRILDLRRKDWENGVLGWVGKIRISETRASRCLLGKNCKHPRIESQEAGGRPRPRPRCPGMGRSARHMLAVMCELSEPLPADFVDEDGSG